MRRTLIPLLLVAACTSKGVQPRPTARPDSADQVYAGMTTEIVRNGVRESQVFADSAWMYQARQLFDLKGLTVTMYDSSGTKISTIVADKGIYHTRDQSLDARGHVVATSLGGKILKTEHLIYDKKKNEISSDSAFTSTSPQGNASGTSFVSDPGFKHVVVDRMKALQKGKGVLLPGQHGTAKP